MRHGGRSWAFIRPRRGHLVPPSGLIRWNCHYGPSHLSDCLAYVPDGSHVLRRNRGARGPLQTGHRVSHSLLRLLSLLRCSEPVGVLRSGGQQLVLRLSLAGRCPSPRWPPWGLRVWHRSCCRYPRCSYREMGSVAPLGGLIGWATASGALVSVPAGAVVLR